MQIGELFVRLRGDAAPLERSLRSAQGSLNRFDSQIGKSSRSMGLLGKSFAGLGATLAASVSFTAIVAGLREAFKEADNFDAAVRKLSATAKITGQNLGFLQKTAVDTKSAFGISTAAAADFTTEIVKLTSKAGQIEKTGDAIGAFLDLGAARGLDATATLNAVRQAILGIDEGTDKLFGKNPSVIYAEFAKQVGISAGAMNDQQKAMALLNAAMVDGGKVAGEFAKWLQTPAGESYKLQVRMDELQAGIGRSMNSVRRTVLPLLSDLVGWLARAATETAVLAAKIPLFFEHVKFQITRLNAETGGAVAGIASKIEGLNNTIDNTLSKLPGGDWTRRVLRAFDISDNIVSGVASAAGRTEEEAAASLAKVEAQVAETVERLRREMSLTLDITGPTNPIATFLDEIAQTATEAAAAIKKAGEAFDKAMVGRRMPIAQLANGAHRITPQFDHTTGRRLDGAPTAPGLDLRLRNAPSLARLGNANFPSGPSGGGLLDSLKGQFSQIGSQVGSQIMGMVAQFGPLAAVAAALRPVFEGLMDTIGPVLTDLAEPLRIVGQLLGSVLAPVLKLLTPPLKLLATIASYVVEALGLLVRAIGKAVDALPFISAKGVIRAGEDMIQSARDSRRALDDLKPGVDDFAEGLNKASAALVNYARVAHINALRFMVGAGVGGGSVTGGAVRPGGRPGLSITVNGMPAEVLVEEGGRVIQRVNSRGGTTRFALAT